MPQPTQITSSSNIPVSFPFPPYNCQISYINSVHQALNNKFNAILESPTGTGKTLCLLTSILSWKKHVEKHNPEKFQGKFIIYASRTHTQLSQAVKELRTCFSSDLSYSTVTSTILASRQHMCINKKVLQESKQNSSALIALCKRHVKNNTCYHKNQVNNTAESFILQRGFKKEEKEKEKENVGQKVGAVGQASVPRGNQPVFFE